MREFNAAQWLVDRHVDEGRGDDVALRCQGRSTTYAELQRELWRVQRLLPDLAVGSGDRVAMVVRDDQVLEVKSPPVTVLEPRGAGDSMTAGIAVGLARGYSLVEAVRLGASAGTLNVTRRGLGTGRRETIERFARMVRVDEVEDAG